MTCDRRNPLQRSGTHQNGRVPGALDPASFGLDDRNLAELLRYGVYYSRELKFYDKDNQVDGDWSVFFSRDPAAILASVSLLPVRTYANLAHSLRQFIDDDKEHSLAHRQQHSKLMFWLPVLLIGELLAVSSRLGQRHHFAQVLAEAFDQHKDSLLWLIRVYRGAVAQNVLTDTSLSLADFNLGDGNNGRPVIPSVVADAMAKTSQPLSTHDIEGWSLTKYSEDDWASLFASADPDPTPFLVQGANINLDGLQSLLRYNLFNRAYRRIMALLVRLAAEAESQLETSLRQQNHEANYGLYVAFLKLFQSNQNELNLLTDRHLKHYYQEILRIPREPGRADSVNLAITLKKNAKPVLLPTGTEVRAGKDNNGDPLYFSLDQNFVPNQSGLEAVKSFYVGVNSANEAVPFASPLAISADGLGEGLPADAPGWHPFGPFSGTARGRLGFAIVDRRLFLLEGKRTITLDLHTDQTLPNRPYAGAFNIFLSAEKEWFEATDLSVSRKTSRKLRIEVRLSGGDPPIIGYDEKIHASGFSVTTAMMRVELALEGVNAESAVSVFNTLRTFTLDRVTLKTKTRGMRNVTLLNDFGKIDPAKPFLPFGPMPEEGSSLRLGSSEIFSKPLDWIELDFSWETSYSYSGFFVKAQRSEYTLDASHLSNGEWQTIPGPHYLFKASGLKFEQVAISPDMDLEIHAVVVPRAPSISPMSSQFKVADVYEQLHSDAVGVSNLNVSKLNYPDELNSNIADILPAANKKRRIKLEQLDEVSGTAVQSETNPPYDAAQRDGFIKLTLDKGFGSTKFQNERTLALIAEVKEFPYAYPQKMAYNYSGGFRIDHVSQNQAFWVGGQPREPYLPRIMEIEIHYETRATPIETFLELHSFGWRTGGDRLLPETAFDGELYLGFSGVDPPSKLSLLFRCLEGTTNPLKNPADLTFSYLGGNEWLDFDPEDVADSSYAVSSTGIVALPIPANADTRHNLLATDLYWIRVAARQDTDAVSQLLEILPNATIANRVLDAKKPAYPQTSLAETTIGKLKDSVTEVKEIVQPDASYNGRPAEQDETYYRRVAERLRHKNRAVSMWDYEHLVLERFPEIYKVKCLNHTRLEKDEANNITADNEVRPGHVVVVPLPFVRATSDRRRPYARKRTLLEIRDFLQDRMSPFVRLEVQNPKVEEVQMKFGVAFTEAIDDVGFYLELLNQDIVRFLTPWMFEEGREVEFGGSWAKSTVIAFVERLDYVDYLKDVRMSHRRSIDNTNSPADTADLDLVHASTGRSVLVSHAQHLITDIRP